MLIGCLETFGYLTIITPFVVAFFDSLDGPIYGKGGVKLCKHMEEGGNIHAEKKDWRKNPFDPDGHLDPFYATASWVKV